MIKKLINAIIVTILIVIGGLTPAFVISLFITIFTDTTIKHCVESGPFWVISVLCIVLFTIFGTIKD